MFAASPETTPEVRPEKKVAAKARRGK
jgi:hypothetical protein